MARGVAYGTRSPHHVLNVPAGNMSALADDPEDFLRFCQRLDSRATSGSFVAREIYGDYLDSLLREAEASIVHNVGLRRVVGEVVGLKPASDGESACVALASGGVIRTDRVVLAFGHFPPRDPAIDNPSFYTSERYIRDPWAAGSLKHIETDGPVLLIGTGLTALDVCVSLAAQSRQRPIYAVSRRGLLPQSHRSPAHAPAPNPLPGILEGIDARVLGYSRAIRAEVAKTVQRGGDWRDVLAALRTITPRLWRRLSETERARFLRHLQPYWDVYRHRAAPEAHARFQELIASGTLQIIAGRLLAFSETSDGVEVTLRRRGEPRAMRITVSRVVNCTGPSSDPRAADDPLIKQLLAQRLLRPDALGLGVEVSENYALLDADGVASKVLYYVGPMLKAQNWEATAVPELRVHAKRLAEQLLVAQSEAPWVGARG
jgi:uncharacterized NAD(P)/FAD-binding protein YdhS